MGFFLEVFPELLWHEKVVRGALILQQIWPVWRHREVEMIVGLLVYQIANLRSM